jgi:hypothetical protein
VRQVGGEVPPGGKAPDIADEAVAVRSPTPGMVRRRSATGAEARAANCFSMVGYLDSSVKKRHVEVPALRRKFSIRNPQIDEPA